MTSHDVVAFARRALRQRRIGHTGTLDPFATGVLPLACGRATRLVRFMAAASKVYEATILFGLVTDSYDITGSDVSRSDGRPAEAEVLTAIDAMRGAQLQMPPSFSAKRIGGQRAYELARKQTPVTLAPAAVSLDAVEVVSVTADRAILNLTCSAGFYVRSFAHDLGQRLGIGACLETLRRTRSGDFDLGQSVTIADIDAGRGPAALIGLAALLPGLAGVIVTPLGRHRLQHGQFVRDIDVAAMIGRDAQDTVSGEPAWIRILDGAGDLIGVGTTEAPGGALRPNIVLI